VVTLDDLRCGFRPYAPYASCVRRTECTVTDLAGIVLPDARSGESVDLGSGPHLALVSVIRHRY